MHLPEGLDEVQKVAVQLEERIYGVATNQVIWPICSISRTRAYVGLNIVYVLAKEHNCLHMLYMFFSCQHFFIHAVGNKSWFFSHAWDQGHGGHLEHIQSGPALSFAWPLGEAMKEAPKIPFLQCSEHPAKAANHQLVSLSCSGSYSAFEKMDINTTCCWKICI
jgi:hypothetical protein